MKKLLLILAIFTTTTHLFGFNFNDPCQNQYNQSQSTQSIHELCTTGKCTDTDCDLSSLNTYQIQTDLMTGSPCVKITSLANVNLEYAYLPGINLSGVDLTNTNLSYSCLTNANIQKAVGPTTSNNPTGAALYGANLTGANLTGANLNGAGLGGALLQSTNFTSAILTNLVTGQVSRNTSGHPVTTDIGINTAFFNNTIFTSANFFDSVSKNGVDFSNISTVPTAQMPNPNIIGTISFNGANLTNANLSSSNLNSMNFTGANLVGATLYYTNLNDANLTNAILTSPTTPAVLNNVNLSGATLTNVDFTGTTFNNVTFVPENTNGTIAAPSTNIAANIAGINFTNATFSNSKGLISLLASYAGPTILSLKGATLGAPNFNAGPSVTLDLTHWDFTNAKIGIFNPDEVSSLIIGGDYNNPADMRTIKFPFMQGVELDNVTVSNLNGDFSFSGAMVNNCWFGSNITNTNKGLAGGLSSKFTINHGSNSTYNNCSFYGILFNNSANPNNPALVGMQKTKFNGALNIKSCYFQTTDFTGMAISPYSKSSINITDTRFVSWGSSKNLASNSFLNQLYAGVTKNTTNYSNINNYFHSGVQWYNINQSNGKDMTWNPYESGASSYDPTNATNSSGSIGL